MRKGIRLPTVLLFVLVVLYAALLLRSPAPQSPRPDTTAVDHLLELMQRRLALMHDVARWKWNHQQEIADPAREQAFLEAMADKAKEKGVDQDLVRRCFRAQIEAAKLIQQAEFDAWKAEQRGPFADVPDLQKELRPRIDALSQELLDALIKAQSTLKNKQTAAKVRERARTIMTDVPEDVRQQAIAPLMEPVAGP